MPETQSTAYLDRDDFEKSLQHDVVLVHCGVSWAVSCNIQNNILENLKKVFKEQVAVVSVDVEQMPDTRQRFRVENVPTLLILEHGKEVKRFEGVQSEKALARELNDVSQAFDPNQNIEVMWDALRDKETEKEIFHKQILLIDDDPDVTFCVRTILEEARFDNIALATDYKSTVEHLEKSIPDLIFLNIGMHNKEGNRIIMGLRKNRDWRNIPVLVSVGPLEATRVYEDTFKNAAILKHGKYVEQPRTRQSFTGLVRHMLLYGEQGSDSQMLDMGGICRPDRKTM